LRKINAFSTKRIILFEKIQSLPRWAQLNKRVLTQCIPKPKVGGSTPLGTARKSKGLAFELRPFLCRSLLQTISFNSNGF